jgi:hypothetical protein
MAWPDHRRPLLGIILILSWLAEVAKYFEDAEADDPCKKTSATKGPKTAISKYSYSDVGMSHTKKLWGIKKYQGHFEILIFFFLSFSSGLNTFPLSVVRLSFGTPIYLS